MPDDNKPFQEDVNDFVESSLQDLRDQGLEFDVGASNKIPEEPREPEPVQDNQQQPSQPTQPQQIPLQSSDLPKPEGENDTVEIDVDPEMLKHFGFESTSNLEEAILAGKQIQQREAEISRRFSELRQREQQLKDQAESIQQQFIMDPLRTAFAANDARVMAGMDPDPWVSRIKQSMTTGEGLTSPQQATNGSQIGDDDLDALEGGQPPRRRQPAAPQPAPQRPENGAGLEQRIAAMIDNRFNQLEQNWQAQNAMNRKSSIVNGEIEGVCTRSPALTGFKEDLAKSVQIDLARGEQERTVPGDDMGFQAHVRDLARRHELRLLNALGAGGAAQVAQHDNVASQIPPQPRGGLTQTPQMGAHQRKSEGDMSQTEFVADAMRALDVALGSMHGRLPSQT